MGYIGIDLGTTNSVATIFNPITGKVEILSVKDMEDLSDIPPDERELIRSVVSFSGGNIFKGWKAFARAKEDPSNSIFSIKRLMGRGYNDKQEYGAGKNKGRFIRELISENHEYQAIKPEGATDDAIAVRVNGKEYTPEEISKHILLEIKRIAESSLNEKVEGAVITVPAYFNEKQCSATVKAAKMAGIDVQGLLNEPCAAAKAYARDNLDLQPKLFLVYDLGGGTFDVSLLTVHGPNITEETIDGDNWLGGDDFNREITDEIGRAHV